MPTREITKPQICSLMKGLGIRSQYLDEFKALPWPTNHILDLAMEHLQTLDYSKVCDGDILRRQLQYKAEMEGKQLHKAIRRLKKHRAAN